MATIIKVQLIIPKAHDFEFSFVTLISSAKVVTILIKKINKKSMVDGDSYCPCNVSNRHRMTCVKWLILCLQKTVNDSPTGNTPHLSREALSRVWTVPSFTLGPVPVSSTSSCSPRLLWTILYRDFTTLKLYRAAKGRFVQTLISCSPESSFWVDPPFT